MSNRDIILSIEQLAAFMGETPRIAAEYYANGDKFDPGHPAPVANHFTRSNAKRYGWEPLMARYQKWKAAHVGKKPILVRTGLLKAATLARSLHKIFAGGDTAIIEFEGLPDYALYHHEGVPNKLPKRSPVEPSAEDIKEVRNYLIRRLKLITGSGSKGRQKFGKNLSTI